MSRVLKTKGCTQERFSMAKTIQGLKKELQRAKKRADDKRDECARIESILRQIRTQKGRLAHYSRRSINLCEAKPSL